MSLAQQVAEEVGAAYAESFGQACLDLPPERWVLAVTAARDAGFTFFDWLSAVDEQDDGVRVVLHLWAPASRRHLLLRTLLPPDAPAVATLTEVFGGAGWHERETAEMFGVTFTDHPAPGRLLLAEGFEGHPLRKSFVLAARVAKPWPGRVEPGENKPRRATPPPGVPATWDAP